MPSSRGRWPSPAPSPELAGSIELLGVTHRLFERFAAGHGYVGIAVALLAQLHPLAAIGSAVFFGILSTGSGELQRSVGMSASIATFAQAVVILVLIAFTAVDEGGAGGSLVDLLMQAIPLAIVAATPLLLTVEGELIVQRSGIINLGVEGMLLAAAFGAAVTSSIAGGIAAAAIVALIFGVLTIQVRADQIVAGTAVNLLVLGLTGFLYRELRLATPPPFGFISSRRWRGSWCRRSSRSSSGTRHMACASARAGKIRRRSPRPATIDGWRWLGKRCSWGSPARISRWRCRTDLRRT